VQEAAAPHSTTFDPAGQVTTVAVGGRAGQVAPSTTSEVDLLLVDSSGRQLRIVSAGVGLDDLVALADAWLDSTDAGEIPPVSDLPLPDGFERSLLHVNPAERSVNLVVVRVREASTGRQVEYAAVPTEWFRSGIVGARATSFSDGVFRVQQVEAGSTAVALIGGPADVVAGISFFGEEVDSLPLPELEAFTAGLRQVAVADWRAALADADAAGAVDPEVLEAPDLYSPPLVDSSPG
jgi:hypothetical protein